MPKRLGNHRVAVRVALTLVAAGTVLLAALYALTPSYLPWLEVHDALEPAPVIVIINGENQRADEAAQLFLRGYGREIWLTNDPRSGSATILDAGTAENLKRLASHGVPPDVIRQMPKLASSTKAELQQIGSELRRRELDRAIVVTSKLHGRRTRNLWACTVGQSPRAVIQSPKETDYVGAQNVRREVLKVFASWLCQG